MLRRSRHSGATAAGRKTAPAGGVPMVAAAAAPAAPLPRSSSLPSHLPSSGGHQPHRRRTVALLSEHIGRRSAHGAARRGAPTAALAALALAVSLVLYAWPSRGQMHELLLDGWIACVATGAGALPAHALQRALGDAKRMAAIALGGCIAAGMMVGASALLVHELWAERPARAELGMFCAGACASALLVRALARASAEEEEEEEEEGGAGGAGGGGGVVPASGCAAEGERARHAPRGRSLVLLVALATDALAEGVAMGVAAHRDERDAGARRSLPLMSLVMAVHNVPEGMAAASAFAMAGAVEARSGAAAAADLLRCALLAMATSVPQPIGGALALSCLRAAGGMLPAVQGAAAGSLAYVALAELLPDAMQHLSARVAAPAALLAALGAAALHELTE